MTVTDRFAAVLALALAAGFTTSAAMATPADVDHSPAKVSDAAQLQTAAVTEDDDSATCSKARKRLWVEGEGWIVRRVTICR